MNAKKRIVSSGHRAASQRLSKKQTAMAAHRPDRGDEDDRYRDAEGHVRGGLLGDERLDDEEEQEGDEKQRTAHPSKVGQTVRSHGALPVSSRTWPARRMVTFIGAPGARRPIASRTLGMLAAEAGMPWTERMMSPPSGTS